MPRKHQASFNKKMDKIIKIFFEKDEKILSGNIVTKAIEIANRTTENK